MANGENMSKISGNGANEKRLWRKPIMAYQLMAAAKLWRKRKRKLVSAAMAPRKHGAG